MNTKEPKNKSVKHLHEIAKQYGYKEEVVPNRDWTACLVLRQPYYRSPYPDRIVSEKRTYHYVRKVFESD